MANNLPGEQKLVIGVAVVLAAAVLFYALPCFARKRRSFHAWVFSREEPAPTADIQLARLAAGRVLSPQVSPPAYSQPAPPPAAHIPPSY